MNSERFELRTPSNQTAADIFKGSWATDLGKVCGVTDTGVAALFEDPRLGLAAASLGVNSRFDNFKVLELGPLEAAHSYQLQQLGATNISAVEANTEAYLKCLLVKEMLQLKARFYCGDVTSFLRSSNEEYDLIFCCGILYHLADPLELIKQICLHSDRCFVWTHYYHAAVAAREGARSPRVATKNGFTTTYFERDYATMEGGLFLGGNRPQTAWMEQHEITRAFARFGFDQAKVLEDQMDHPNGAAFSCAYHRTR